MIYEKGIKDENWFEDEFDIPCEEINGTWNVKTSDGYFAIMAADDLSTMLISADGCDSIAINNLNDFEKIVRKMNVVLKTLKRENDERKKL